ncbi:ankyrin repeat domain-containing protein [Aliikangiella maris]|uniref:Ankyrin repeat domain-containing protein n=2 Tax=Aliikangiella maris TaxID=3162458 RepID=A0ABV2BZZ1_9GAMM
MLRIARHWPLIFLFVCFSSSCSAKQNRLLEIDLKACDVRDSTSELSKVLDNIESRNTKLLETSLTDLNDINIISKKMTSLLSCSIFYDNKDAFKLLLERGASPNLAFKNGRSLIHLAAKLKDSYYLQSLLEYGARVDQINSKKGWAPTALYYAVSEANTKNIELLLGMNAEIDYRNSMMETPLLYVAGLLDYDTTYYLLSKGADFRLKDNQGYDLKMVLEEQIISRDSELFTKKFKVISFLIDRGIEVKY